MNALPASTAESRALADLDLILPPPIRKRLAERCAARRGKPVAELSAVQWADGIFRKSVLPGRRRRLAVRSVCTVVRMIAGEMVFLTGGRVPDSRSRRFAMSHIQQIAMYVCHVVLQMTMTEIALAFGKDRTTVGHACARVEDRRDDGGYDLLVGAVERVVDGVFGRAAAVPKV